MNKKSRNRSGLLRNSIWGIVLDFIYVLIGSSLIAIAFNLFLMPNKIASGGVSGISTILHWKFGLEPSYVQWALNIPLFIVGVLILGKSLGYVNFALKTIVGTIFLPFVVFLTSGLDAATTNPILGAIFGGVGVGLGLGFVFRGKGSTGGTDLLAQIIHKFTGLQLGICVVLIDGLIVVNSAFTLSLESALYALVSMYLTGKVIDVVQLGISNSKLALIISEHQNTLKQAIFEEIDRGVTQMEGRGGYTDDARPVLMVVVSQNELTRLKQLVKRIDPKAFLIVSNATEVFGEGFRRHY
ncbi:YitT family protein [Terrilactibacillus laevilacticus]|uniref:YitT family protein n=1 Tax=Terrilactibacillus laevilacticus TaxID=1380157 RepID=UPI001147543C|nr:YitT family protein [Terrilactibacillus laevilacticus]